MTAIARPGQQTTSSTRAGPDVFTQDRSVQAQSQADAADTLTAQLGPAASTPKADVALVAGAAIHVTEPIVAATTADAQVQAASSLAPAEAGPAAATVTSRANMMQMQPSRISVASGTQSLPPMAAGQGAMVATRDAAVSHVLQASIAAQVGMAVSEHTDVGA